MPPFDGLCVRNIGELKLSQLREILSQAFGILRPRFPSINRFHDWHEHDGFIGSAKEVSWDQLIAVAENELTLFKSRDDDFGVRIAIFSSTFDWLLRYNIDSNDESEYSTAVCDFDLSASPISDSASILNELRDRFPGLLMDCKSQPWFASQYGG